MIDFAYTLIFVILFGVFYMIDFILDNWDVIGLLITNVLAYFSPSPRQKRIK